MGVANLTDAAIVRIRWALDLGAPASILAACWDVKVRTITAVGEREIGAHVRCVPCPYAPVKVGFDKGLMSSQQIADLPVAKRCVYARDGGSRK